MPRFNTFGSASARAWRAARVTSVDYLGVADGGSGGSTVHGSLGNGGGGGGGELKTGSLHMIVGNSIGVTFLGGNITLTGRLAGTLHKGGNGGAPIAGGSAGGSGGGASNGAVNPGGASTAAFGVGYPGGAGTATGGPIGIGKGAGGGGAGGPGVTGVGGTSGAGGPGVVSSISGVAVEYGYGGTEGTARNGLTPGSGGDGSYGPDNSDPGVGHAGVFIVRYLGAQHATGGVITSVGGYTIHTFTANGTFVMH